MKARDTDAKDPRFGLSWARELGLVDELAEKLAVKVKEKKRRRRKVAAVSGAGVLVLFLGLWGVPYARDTGELATVAAQRQAFGLRDGSRVELNARSGLATDFRYGRRRVKLERGEAFFSVARDAAHPFVVETPAGSVEVLGTAFNVRLSDGGRAEVTLVEGGVAVSAPAGVREILKPAEQASVAAGAVTRRELDAKTLSAAMAWRTGRLELDTMSLQDAAARVAAFHGVTITVDAKVGDLKPGGVCPLEDLDGFLESMGTVLPVRVVKRSPGEYAISPR